MNRKREILELIQKRVLILDGATGSQLQARGLPHGVCPEQWCLEYPEHIKEVHTGYKAAGSDMISTFTFGANRFKLFEYGFDDVHGMNKGLARIAREAVGNEILVAGDIGPMGRFIEPFGEVSFEDAVAVFKEQVRGLLEGGVDMFMIETMLDIQEARAALIAVREITESFTIVTMTYERGGRTLSGTDSVSALITLQALGADAVGCNCSTGPQDMLPLIEAMKPFAKVPLVAKPNAGLPRLVEGRTIFEMGAEEFGAFGKAFVAAGVNLLGGCCGTAPDHIRVMASQVADAKPIAPLAASISALSSARRNVILHKDTPLVIIGERINPTGKPALQEELKEGKFSLVRQFAREQEQDGAMLLDVNVGTPGIDEVKTIRDAVCLLSTMSDLPLVIDSSNVEAVEAALRIYPGRALINSIPGEVAKLKRLLPLAKKYGAMFILLPLTDDGIPRTSTERKAVILQMYREVHAQGFFKEDIVVDALAMTVSTDQAAASETLNTIEWCAKEFGVRIVIGLSNVSFGLPERRWINAGFLAMAAARGLSLAIANPGSEELMSIKLATDVLRNKDKGAKAYIEKYGNMQIKVGNVVSETHDSPIELVVHNAILEGNREEISAFLDRALGKGIAPDALVNEIMIPAIRQVGDLYEQKTYFLPQLIASAETVQKGFARLEPLISAETKGQKKGRIIMATVKGDIHDIGKNIVCLMLKNNGFEVIDLGKDVPHETIIDAMKKHQPDLVGLSALMTTTMVKMQEVIERAKDSGLTCPFMVGGAVVTRTYAESIGAAYAKDGVEAVKVAEGHIKRS